MTPALSVPALSVLVCTRNRADKLRRAVASILSNSYRDFELIVIDQSTDDGTQRAIAGFADPRLRYLRTPTVGLSISRNIAVRMSRAETLVFTDDDCVCAEDWLLRIVAEFAADPAIMAVYGRVVPFEGPKDGMFCPAVNESLDRRLVDHPVIPAYVLGGGNNMSFRKEVFRTVGLFIETLGAGTAMKSGEDTEFCFRALRRGFKFVYSPLPLVYHDNWMTKEEFGVLMRASILGGTAVMARFSLRLDGTALLHVARTASHILRSRDFAGSISGGLKSWFAGTLMGLKYAFVSPPKLQV